MTPVVEPGLAQRVAEHHVGHRGAADVAQAHQRHGVPPGRARGRQGRCAHRASSPSTASSSQVATVITIAPHDRGPEAGHAEPEAELAGRSIR